MARAIGVALDGREPAIGEFPASRIAERPPAGRFANVLEPHPSHLSNLGFAKSPRRLSVIPRRDFANPSKGARWALLAGAGLSMPNARPLRFARALRLAAR